MPKEPNWKIKEVNWEDEFTLLLRYTQRLERVNDELLKNNSALTALMEKLIANGNTKV